MSDRRAARGGSTSSPAAAPPVSPRIIDETDGYTSSVAGATVEAVRVGRGEGPNVVMGVPGERFTATSSTIGFPMLTHSHIAEGKVVATFMHDSRGDSRWCGVPLRPGMVMLYGPGAEHVAVNRPGLRFTFAITDVDHLQELAGELDLPIETPPHGGAQEICASPSTRAFGRALSSYCRGAASRNAQPSQVDDVLVSFAHLLGRDRRPGVRRGKGIDSRAVVHSCVEFAQVIDRVPSLSELCLAAHVSERRLRQAFAEEFDQPPSRFFRAWALGEAHRRLRDAGPDECSVTDVAAGLGFDHLGRFAGYYRHIYGECPSATLAGPAQAAS